MPVITRKIQIGFDCPSSELKQYYKLWFQRQRTVVTAANLIVSELFIQDKIKDFFYLKEDAKIKMANWSKDPEGIIDGMSRDNTIYQMLSKKFKEENPGIMGMLSSLSQIICQTYKKELVDVLKGKRSLRSYKDNIPMPIRARDTSRWKKGEDGNYTFYVYGTPFKTYFGKDLSGNEIILDRAINSEYKLCDSAIQLQKKGLKWKMYLLATFSFEKVAADLDKSKIAECYLDPIVAIKVKRKKGEYDIGNAEEFHHGRIAIHGAFQRLQKSLKYTKGGKGRKYKLKALESFGEKEKRYMEHKMHVYSRELIGYCLKNKIGTIRLNNYEYVSEATKNDKLLLPAWSYFNLTSKIIYKAAMNGIEVLIPKDEKEDKEETSKLVAQPELEAV